MSFDFKNGFIVNFEVFKLLVVKRFLIFGIVLIIGRNFGVNGLKFIFVLMVVVLVRFGVDVSVLFNILCCFLVVICRLLRLVLFLCVVLVIILLLLNERMYWLFGGIIIGYDFVFVFVILKCIICVFWKDIWKWMLRGFMILLVYVFVVIIIVLVVNCWVFVWMLVIVLFLKSRDVFFLMIFVLCFFVVFKSDWYSVFLFIWVVLLIWIDL